MLKVSGSSKALLRVRRLSSLSLEKADRDSSWAFGT